MITTRISRSVIEDGQVDAGALAMLAEDAVAERAQGGQLRGGKFAADHLGGTGNSSAARPGLRSLVWIYDSQAKMLMLKVARAAPKMAKFP